MARPVRTPRAVKTGRITRPRKTSSAINVNAIVETTDLEVEVHGDPPAWAEVSISSQFESCLLTR